VLDALLKIIERLIAIRQGRVVARKELFDKILEPTFNELLLIHGDYLKMFEDLRVFGAPRTGGEIELIDRAKNARDVLRKRRLEFGPVRQKTRGVSDGLAAQELGDEEKDFVEAVVRYFPSGEPSLPQSSASAVLAYLDRDLKPEDIDLLISKTIQRHVAAWSDVCTSFGRLKVAVTRDR